MLGARFEPGGVRFNVWAPNADRAFVAYDGHWTIGSAFELTRTGDYFVGLAHGITVGMRYKYVFLRGSDAPSWRIDPAARDTTHSGLNDQNNGAFVVDVSHQWPSFRTPAFENLIIYQLHVGTFAGRNDEFVTTVKDRVANIGSIKSKLSYISALGFNAVELLPIQEFQSDRSWGYNPSFYYSIESAYGSPQDVRDFVATAHSNGLAVLLDVVYNHVSDNDNSLWNWDIYHRAEDHGEYLFPPHRTDWGNGPAFEKQAVREFFVENALMLLGEYQVDGLRFDATRVVESNRGAANSGWKFLQELTWRIKERFPDKYLVAEHLPDHETIVRDAGMNGTWFAAAHHEFQRASQGEDPVTKLRAVLGKDFGFGRSYANQWNVVKYFLGSHDDCGDDQGGATQDKPGDWERHRYFVEFYGGRDNWHARAKARLGWVLNVVDMGTPMMFMGLECHHPGYWHDDTDRNGDHRFDWAIAGDPIGMEMRRLVAAANAMRWSNPCLRSEALDIVQSDYENQVLAIKRYVAGANNCLLIIANMGERTFGSSSYGVSTGGQLGQWSQILCSQDAQFGGWDGAGNAFYEPWTQDDGNIYINLPQWSIVVMRLL